MENIGISVIIAMYNTSNYIEECLLSIKKQSFSNYELILVDDCSTDNSYAIAESVLKDFPKSKLIRNTSNKGAGACRNIGLDAASGKYLLFLDSDDFFESSMLEKMYSMMESSGADVAKCGFCLFDDTVKKRKMFDEEDLYRIVEEEKPFTLYHIKELAFQVIHEIAWDKMFRASFVKEHCIRFQEQHNANDQLFVFKSLLYAKSIIATKSIGTNWRRNVNNQLSKGGFSFPLCIYEATKETYMEIKNNKSYKEYNRSFNEYALNRLIQSIKMAREEDKGMLYDFYLKDGLRGLSMDNLNLYSFNSPYYYGKYRNFRNTNILSKLVSLPKVMKFDWNNKRCIELLKILSNKTNLVLYGFGVNGRKMYAMSKIYNVSWHMICDRMTKIDCDEDINVISPEEIKNESLIVTTNPNHIGYLRYLTKKLGKKVKCLDSRAYICCQMDLDSCIIDLFN